MQLIGICLLFVQLFIGIKLESIKLRITEIIPEEISFDHIYQTSVRSYSYQELFEHFPRDA